MRAVAKKVQILRLQEQNYMCQADAEEYCIKQCKIDKKCIKLDKNTVKKRTQKEKQQKKSGMKDVNKQYNYLIKGWNIQLLQKKWGAM